MLQPSQLVSEDVNFLAQFAQPTTLIPVYPPGIPEGGVKRQRGRPKKARLEGEPEDVVMEPEQKETQAEKSEEPQKAEGDKEMQPEEQQPQKVDNPEPEKPSEESGKEPEKPEETHQKEPENAEISNTKEN